MDKIYYWHQCIECGLKLEPADFYYTCPKCSGLLLVYRDEEYVKSKIGNGQQARNYFDNLRYGSKRKSYPNDSGVWLWRDLLLPGFPEQDIISLKEGQTDLFEVPDWLLKDIGLDKLYIKLEGQAPSESFKDRGMPVAVSDALRLKRAYPEKGILGITCASTGDTSAAAAIYAAYCRDKIGCLVLVPADKISDSQLFQAMAYGAKVRALVHPDGFDGCMKMIQQFTLNHPEYILVNSKNDMRVVGQESIALEIIQDLNWNAPDWISIPVGNAGNLTALLNSLKRAYLFGLINKIPGIIVAQTSAADTLVRWSNSGYKEYLPHEYKDTVASAMNINNPVSFPRIKQLLKNINVKFYSVKENDIYNTWAQYTRAGANICPQGAVALNAVQQAISEGVIIKKDQVVSISTASMLKFTESGVKYHTAKNPQIFANPYKIVNGNIQELESTL